MKEVDSKYKIDNAYRSLIGVSIGDAFGDSFFGELDKILMNIHEG